MLINDNKESVLNELFVNFDNFVEYTVKLNKTLVLSDTKKDDKPLANNIKGLIKQAEEGNTDAMYLCGRAFALGDFFTKIDRNKGLYYYKNCFLRGNLKGLCGISMLYYNDGKKDETKYILSKVYPYLENYANENDPWAIAVLGQAIYMLANDSEDAKTKTRAIGYLSKAVSKGNPFAMNTLAYHYLKEDSLSDAIGLYERTAILGSVGAMYNLGWIFSNKFEDYIKSVEWYQKAAKYGHIDAIFNLGIVYLYDIKNKEKAIEWLEKAAKLGDIKAKRVLNDLYSDQEGSLYNQRKASKWQKEIQKERGNITIGLDPKSVDWQTQTKERIRDSLVLAEKGDIAAVYKLIFLNKIIDNKKEENKWRDVAKANPTHILKKLEINAGVCVEVFNEVKKIYEENYELAKNLTSLDVEQLLDEELVAVNNRLDDILANLNAVEKQLTALNEEVEGILNEFESEKKNTLSKILIESDSPLSADEIRDIVAKKTGEEGGFGDEIERGLNLLKESGDVVLDGDKWSLAKK